MSPISERLTSPNCRKYISIFLRQKSFKKNQYRNEIQDEPITDFHDNVPKLVALIEDKEDGFPDPSVLKHNKFKTKMCMYNCLHNRYKSSCMNAS